MVLMKPGCWHDTVWADRTWPEDLWLEYGAVAPPPVGGPSRTPIKPSYEKPLPLPRDMMQLLISYLETKLGE